VLAGALGAEDLAAAIERLAGRAAAAGRAPRHLRPPCDTGIIVSADPDTVAVITDIHGNLPALQAVLARIE